MGDADPAVLAKIDRIEREYQAMQAQYKDAALARVVDVVGAASDSSVTSS